MEGIIETLCLQIKNLTEQNNMLMEQNKYLMNKNQMLMDKDTNHLNMRNIKSKEIFLENELNQMQLGDYDWISFLANIKEHLILDDIKFIQKGYKQCIVDIIARIFSNLKHKPFYTLSKKSKIMVLYKNNIWEKIPFSIFVEEVKKLTNSIIHGCVCKFKHNISRDIFDETLEIMLDDTNKFKEQIANALIENCIIIF